ncbi:hypothetical protein GCM10023149_15890 [Mucilaginibacter gynuensis]|uniref:Uncharacterized protein n=1 Tax=Mucilaginibacter gynuensis TaxID=1302236 RepID=A0ABP8G5N9_9SPHI
MKTTNMMTSSDTPVHVDTKRWTVTGKANSAENMVIPMNEGHRSLSAVEDADGILSVLQFFRMLKGRGLILYLYAQELFLVLYR